MLDSDSFKISLYYYIDKFVIYNFEISTTDVILAVDCGVLGFEFESGDRCNCVGGAFAAGNISIAERLR